MPRGVDPLRWNPTLARYIDARGRIVSTSAVRRALDASVQNAANRARELAAELRGGTRSLASWELEMRTLIKDVHIWSAAGAVGGWAQLGPAEYGRIGSLVRDQYEYLYGFAQDVASGRQRLTNGLTARAVMYVEAGRTAFEAQQLASDTEAGYDEEANVEGIADHCGECPDWTARGWLPLGTIPLPGRRECLTRCKCHLARRMSDAARARRRRRERTAAQSPSSRTTAAVTAAAIRERQQQQP